MRVAIGADHAGVVLKQELAAYMADLGHTVTDMGTNDASPVDLQKVEAMEARFQTHRSRRGVGGGR